MKPLVIGFGHQTGVGKDAACAAVAKKLRGSTFPRGRPLRVVVRKFASGIKDTSYDLFGPYGLKPGAWYEEEGRRELRKVALPKVGKTPEEIWIHVGTAMREIYEPVWADKGVQNLPDVDLVLFSDVRSLMETAAIQGAGGKLVKVTRPGNRVLALDRLIPDDWDWDAVLENTGSLDELGDKAVSFVLGTMAINL